MKRFFLVALLIGLFNEACFTQGFDKAKLDNYFNTLETNNRFMGSVAISQNGKTIYTKSIGFSDLENQTRANEHSKYRIGSISKTFTAVLILTAVEEKKLDLNQPIGKYFPSIKNADKITIRHLLSHRSGIHNFTDDEDYKSWETKAKKEQEMVEIIARKGIDFEPDSQAVYSNSNFVLLTYILEKTYKKSYAALLKKYITQALGLTNTYLGSKIDSKKSEAKSYSFINNWQLETETDISIPLGAGGIVSTPVDLAKFSDALFSGKLLKKESLDRMKTIRDDYGMGLFQMPFDNKIGYGHTGGIDDFTSVFCFFPTENIAYALTSNGTNYVNNNISIAVLSAAFNAPYELPSFKTFAVSSEDLDKYLGVYSSSQFPLKITITKDNNTLISQATGQASFPLEPTDKDIFKFDQAGVILEFNPAEKTMIVKQGGQQITFKKE